MTEINFHLGDCMDFMRRKPDNYYDLAVVDPPYGGGGSGDSPFPAAQAGSEGGSTDTEPDNGDTRNTRGRFAKYERRELPPPRIDCARTGGTWAAKYSRKSASEPDKRMGGELQNYPPPAGRRGAIRLKQHRVLGLRSPAGILRRAFPRVEKPDNLGR